MKPDKVASSSSGNYKPGTYVYQALQTINAEEIKKVIKLMETANEQYLAQQDEEDEETPATQPAILAETFPACGKDKELNIAEVLVTCNFIFRDA
jgi:ATP-dependent DNA helicase 2 subunit 1